MRLLCSRTALSRLARAAGALVLAVASGLLVAACADPTIEDGTGNDGLKRCDGSVCECRSSAECTNVLRPACLDGKCQPCAPNDRKYKCALGKYCKASGSDFVCAPGCGADIDCEGLSDGGTLRCDTMTNTCIGCSTDAHCPIGQVCKQPRCAPGCTPQRGCAGVETCCDLECVDIVTDTRHCGTCGNTCRQGQACCPGGDCADFQTNIKHCGGCKMACSSNHMTPTCTAGQCDGPCTVGYTDCNNDKRMDGCEAALDVDPNNCGMCGLACSTNHVMRACAAASCQAGVCDAGYADCNGNKLMDGCETPTGSDPKNCGTCGKVCPGVANGTGGCTGGKCGVGTCNAGFADCDGNAANGCETNTNTDANHCAGCGKVCPAVANGKGGCSGGVCGVGTCNAGYGNCDGNAANGCETNTGTDVSHCGGCGMACSSANITRACSGGNCTGVCSAGYGDCNGNKRTDGCEQSLKTVTNCATCGTTCDLLHAVSSCATGTCGLTGCDTGWDNCNGVTGDGCEYSHAATNACGSAEDVGARCGDVNCGTFCPAAQYTPLATRSGKTSRWFKGRSDECSACPANVVALITLGVPQGIDYDLYVYASCGGTVAGLSLNGAGQTETLLLKNGTGGLGNNGFDYWVEVRYIRGSSCSPWSLEMDGTTCTY